MRRLVLILIFLIGVLPSSAASIPTINSYVTDNAGILSQNAKSQLETDLMAIEKQTKGAQFVIYIENEYSKEYSIERYTLKIAETNKIGKKGNDNGILLYIAVKDRKYRWEVGYGAESTLNSALLGRISRDYLVPNFRSGDYEKGILQAVDVAERIILGSNDADIAALKNETETSNRLSKLAIPIIVILIFFFVFWILIATAANRWFKDKQTSLKNKNYKTKASKDTFYHGAAWGLFAGGFGRGGFGGSGGFGGFSGGGGGFGGGGHSGGF